MKSGVIIFLTMVSISGIGAQPVTGLVTDSQTGKGIPGVEVAIKGTGTTVLSDASGAYSIEDGVSGIVSIFASGNSVFKSRTMYDLHGSRVTASRARSAGIYLEKGPEGLQPVLRLLRSDLEHRVKSAAAGDITLVFSKSGYASTEVSCNPGDTRNIALDPAEYYVEGIPIDSPDLFPRSGEDNAAYLKRIDLHDELVSAMNAAAPGPVKLKAGHIYPVLKALDVYRISSAVKSSGFISEGPSGWETLENTFTGDGSKKRFKVGAWMGKVEVYVDGEKKMPDSVPLLTTSITNNLLQRNDYNLIRPEREVLFHKAPAAGAKIRIVNRYKGAVILAVGDWSVYPLNGDKNRLIGASNTLHDDPVGKVVLKNISLDCNANPVNGVRNHVNRIEIENIFIVGARSYSYQFRSRGGYARSVDIEHVLPVRKGEMEAGHIENEDAWFPARETWITDGSITNKNNNGADFGAYDTRFDEWTVDMRGNSTQSAFWQNGSQNCEYHDIRTIDGQGGIGAEQCMNLDYYRPVVVLSGAASPNASFNARIGFFKGVAGISENMNVYDAQITSDQNSGFAYSINCHGKIIGGLVDAPIGVRTHADNTILIKEIDLSKTDPEVMATGGGALGPGITYIP